MGIFRPVVRCINIGSPQLFLPVNLPLDFCQVVIQGLSCLSLLLSLHLLNIDDVSTAIILCLAISLNSYYVLLSHLHRTGLHLSLNIICTTTTGRFLTALLRLFMLILPPTFLLLSVLSV